MLYHHQMVLAQSVFPNPDIFYNQVRDEAMPQILGLGVACLGCILAVLLIKSLRNV